MHTSSLLVPIFIFYSDLLPRTIPEKSWSLHNVDRSRFFGFWRINHSTAGDEISKVSLIWTSTKIAVKRLVYFLRLCSPFFSSRRKSHFFLCQHFCWVSMFCFFSKKGVPKNPIHFEMGFIWYQVNLDPDISHGIPWWGSRNSHSELGRYRRLKVDWSFIGLPNALGQLPGQVWRGSGGVSFIMFLLTFRAINTGKPLEFVAFFVLDCCLFLFGGF